MRLLNTENVNTLISMAIGALENSMHRRQLMAQFDGVLEDVRANGDEDTIVFVSSLRRVAMEGVGAIPTIEMPDAYREPWLAFVAQVRGAGQPALLDVIASNTIAVMTAAPHQKTVWLENVAHNLAQVKANNDEEMTTLLESIHLLVLTGSPPQPAPALEGEYAACWDRIMAALPG